MTEKADNLCFFDESFELPLLGEETPPQVEDPEVRRYKDLRRQMQKIENKVDGISNFDVPKIVKAIENLAEKIEKLSDQITENTTKTEAFRSDNVDMKIHVYEAFLTLLSRSAANSKKLRKVHSQQKMIFEQLGFLFQEVEEEKPR